MAMRAVRWKEVDAAKRSAARQREAGSAVLWREPGAAQDAYALLEVARNADVQTIRRSYRALMEKFHPDRQPEHLRLWAEEMAKQINAAYALLKDDARRAAYDAACGLAWKHETSR